MPIQVTFSADPVNRMNDDDMDRYMTGHQSFSADVGSGGGAKRSASVKAPLPGSTRG